MSRILITGSAGLIGSALVRSLRDTDVIQFDARVRGDVREHPEVQRAIADCKGIVHLAAVSRVIWAERDPSLCWTTNVDGMRNVLEVALRTPSRPWVIVASSREVYGSPEQLPVSEASPLVPINIYGRSKVAAEQLAIEHRARGLRVAILRFSNVFGSPHDHADRVVPAFVRAALGGRPLRLEGSDNSFDFTHVDDVVRGIRAMMDALEEGRELPPIHFVSGLATSLAELAAIVIEETQSASPLLIAPPRSFDVASFRGDGSRAKELLGWSPSISLREGIARLVRDHRKDAS